MGSFTGRNRLINARDIAKALTSIEDGHSPQLPGETGRALVIGVTGAPGAGKSTFCDSLAHVLRREGKTVAILAVDPSSPYTGGAILGDRIRMQRHSGDAGVFIRSMAARGESGGLATATRNAVEYLDACGFDAVLVETVGVGQSEVEIARLAQVTVVLLVPGAGDDVQSIKAGLMEIADVMVVNKADLTGADTVVRDVKLGLALGHRADLWDVPVLSTVASQDQGIDEVLAAARAYREYSLAHPRATLTARTTIDHIGIAVRSIDQALDFYVKQLGLDLAARETVEVERVHTAMLPVGESRIELLEPVDADSTVAKFLSKRGEGIHHIALKVPDLAATVARLAASGARLLNEPRSGAGGHTYVFVHPASTGGVLLELIQL